MNYKSCEWRSKGLNGDTVCLTARIEKRLQQELSSAVGQCPNADSGGSLGKVASVCGCGPCTSRGKQIDDRLSLAQQTRTSKPHQHLLLTDHILVSD